MNGVQPATRRKRQLVARGQLHCRHIPSGETALIMFHNPNWRGETQPWEVFAQFDRFSHKHSHNWWSYKGSEFEVLR